MGYFHASELLKLAFLSPLTRKYILWKDFYHDFSTKKASASGGFAPWPPSRGSAPWTPEVPSPPNDLPWRRPCWRLLLIGTVTSKPQPSKGPFIQHRVEVLIYRLYTFCRKSPQHHRINATPQCSHIAISVQDGAVPWLGQRNAIAVDRHKFLH